MCLSGSAYHSFAMIFAEEEGKKGAWRSSGFPLPLFPMSWPCDAILHRCLPSVCVWGIEGLLHGLVTRLASPNDTINFTSGPSRTVKTTVLSAA